jgi:hypothetical protein
VRHRRENDLQVLLRVAEHLLPVEHRNRRRHRRRRFGHFLETQPAARNPLAIRLRGGERALQLVVVDDASGFEIDEQHLARLQPPLLDDLRLRNVEHADFRRHDDVVVVGDDKARGTQSVAVERRADLASIGEGHRGRPVPRLHQRRMVFVECAPVFVHQRIAGPGFGNHQHHRVRQRVAAHREQFERVVERRGIRLAFVDQRPELRQVVAEHLRSDRAFTRTNPVEVAAQCVDLAVVADEAERMREVPRRKRVRRKALVHHRERGHHRRVVQVDVVLAHLVREQHSLVDDRARRERRHVELLAMAQVERLDRVARALADHVQLALESVLIHVARAARDKYLPDHRLHFLRALRQTRVVGRHVAPAEQNLPLGRDRALDFLLARHARSRLLRQEHHADAILADRRQRDRKLAARAPKERIG